MLLPWAWNKKEEEEIIICPQQKIYINWIHKDRLYDRIRYDRIDTLSTKAAERKVSFLKSYFSPKE